MYTAQEEARLPQFGFAELCAKMLYTYDGMDKAKQNTVTEYSNRFIKSMVEDDPLLVAHAIRRPGREAAQPRPQLYLIKGGE